MMPVILKTIPITTAMAIIMVIRLQRFQKKKFSTKLIHNIQEDNSLPTFATRRLQRYIYTEIYIQRYNNLRFIMHFSSQKKTALIYKVNGLNSQLVN